jgi:hypothetical protein
MSTFPEPVSHNPEEGPSGEPAELPASDSLIPESLPTPRAEWTGEPEAPTPQPDTTTSQLASLASADLIPSQSLFATYAQPQLPPAPSEERIPHLGHLGLLALFAIFGLFGASMLTFGALQLHLWGISKLSQAATDFHYTLASQAAQYLITLAACVGVFPIMWHRSFFSGVHWEAAVAVERFWRLVGAAIVCFCVAMINSVVMPGPTNAPIDQLFKAPGAAWVLFAFGVTLAPFFEEMAFRGFLLPSLCTAFDWVADQISPQPVSVLDRTDRPTWKPRAFLFASLIVGVPFLSLYPRPEGHYIGRILFVLLWAAAMGVWWFRSSFLVQRSVHPPLLDDNRHPRWSLPAMCVSALLTSVPFAMLHGTQTAWSLGPFLLLIFVSLVLCWVRLRTRSLAASTIVHACYNFMLFSFMLLGTGGFRHLDKM